MPFNGSGTWNRLYNWATDKANGINITASRMDGEFNDMATNLAGNTLTRDGQGQPSANLPMNGFKHTGAANATATGQYLTYGQTGAKLGITNARFTSLAGPNYSTTSASSVMCGFGSSSSWALTPNLTGKVRFRCSGMMQNSTSGDGVTLSPSYGTGTAPVAGAAITGTQPLSAGLSGIVTGANGIVPFTAEFEVTGLTLSTAYWFDLAEKVSVGGTATVTVLWVVIEEF